MHGMRYNPACVSRMLWKSGLQYRLNPDQCLTINVELHFILGWHAPCILILYAIAQSPSVLYDSSAHAPCFATAVVGTLRYTAMRLFPIQQHHSTALPRMFEATLHCIAVYKKPHPDICAHRIGSQSTCTHL